VRREVSWWLRLLVLLVCSFDHLQEAIFDEHEPHCESIDL
jgi:hypothetical protein